ncbi:uncharacterized protein LOC126881750 [Diabrotica virgifera virgifera]|uniref:Uncharacterized protein n=1 Tax=Diabrotica virgifera virgifera TaxID=50390 RepID=A0ABM5JW66_DIAVI|nr:uncharacterized protein LOC126881750 [Diabrotica virgifera virgifera]
MTNKRKYNSSATDILDTNGILISESTKILETWKQYVENLFASDRPNNYSIEITENSPSILNSEVKKAICSLKNNKSPGPDNIHAEVLNLCETDNSFLETLTTLFNNIYDRCRIPEN